jgi:hypothetical protein
MSAMPKSSSPLGKILFYIRKIKLQQLFHNSNILPLFQQSPVEQDRLGQAFEDAFEVLRQHSTADLQYSPGKEKPVALFCWYIAGWLVTYRRIRIMARRGGSTHL